MHELERPGSGVEVRLWWLGGGFGGEPPGRERQARIAGSDGGEKRLRAAGNGEGEGAPSTVHPPVWFKRFHELRHR